MASHSLDRASYVPLRFWERLGGLSRLSQLIAFLVHFLHRFVACVSLYSWINISNGFEELESILPTYAAAVLIGASMHVFVASPFYMWAWRFAEPEEMAKRRFTFGCMIDFFIGDIFSFAIELKIQYNIIERSALLIVSFVLICVAFSYSVFRVWIFIVQQMAKWHQKIGDAIFHPIYRHEKMRDSAAFSLASRVYGNPNDETENDGSFTHMSPVGWHPSATPSEGSEQRVPGRMTPKSKKDVKAVHKIFLSQMRYPSPTLRGVDERAMGDLSESEQVSLQGLEEENGFPSDYNGAAGSYSTSWRPRSVSRGDDGNEPLVRPSPRWRDLKGNDPSIAGTSASRFPFRSAVSFVEAQEGRRGDMAGRRHPARSNSDGLSVPERSFQDFF